MPLLEGRDLLGGRLQKGREDEIAVCGGGGGQGVSWKMVFRIGICRIRRPVIDGLDLVITTDTVMLTGGSDGKPVWILLPWQADCGGCRSGRRRRGMDARLFRQAGGAIGRGW